MNADDDVQTQILREIWNEMKALNSRVDKTNAELSKTNAELSKTNAELTKTRVELNDKVEQLREHVTTSIEHLRDELGNRIERVELETKALRTATRSGFETLARADRRRDSDIDELRSRVDRIEQHVGLRST